MQKVDKLSAKDLDNVTGGKREKDPTGTVLCPICDSKMPGVIKPYSKYLHCNKCDIDFQIIQIFENNEIYIQDQKDGKEWTADYTLD